MKISRNKIATLLLLVGTSLSAQTPDSIVHRNVTVEREFKPVIQSAGKINSTPKTLEPKIEKTAPNYADFNLPLTADFNIHTLSAAELERKNQQKDKGGYARIGLGNFFNTLADFNYPIVKKSTSRLDISLNHLATFGKKALSITKGTLAFDRHYKKFDLYMGQSGGHEYFNYYGNNSNQDSGVVVNLAELAQKYPLATFTEKNRSGNNLTPRSYKLNALANDSINNNLWRSKAYIGIRSLARSKGLQYKAELQYKLFDLQKGIAEHQIHTQAGLSNANKENRMGLDLDLYNSMYHAYHSAPFNFNNTYSVISLNPYYHIERPSYDLRLGLKTSISFANGKPFNPSPDLRVEWKAIPNCLAAYAGISGNYAVNSLNDIYTENRYMITDMRVENTYTPYNFFAGIKLKPLYNLLLDLYVDFRSINNQYFFVNKEYDCTSIASADSALYTNRFNVLYSEATRTTIGMRANYNIQSLLNIEIKGAYNGWHVSTEQYAWNKPKWEANLNADLHLTRDWSVSMNTFIEGERFAKLGIAPLRMRPKVDINLGTSYIYNKRLTTFAKINNLINNPYQDFYGYQVQGMNILLGAALSF